MTTYPPLCWQFWCWGFWVRVFGIGVHVRDARQLPPLFSERNGYARVVTLGPLLVKLLTR